MTKTETAPDVGINVAFLQEIKEDHVDLARILQKIEHSFQQARTHEQTRELTYLMLALQDRVAFHFSLEESLGYCVDSLSIAPRLTPHASALRAQHTDLLRAASQLTLIAQEAYEDQQGKPRPFCQAIQKLHVAFREFRDALLQHEDDEMELIVSAYSDDLGGGD